MAEYNAFLNIVKERHDPSISDTPICPYCNSSNINNATGSTLVVGNFNHISKNSRCLNCNRSFILEIKENSNSEPIRWITNERKILKGIPGCFEDYIYTCSKCNGEVHRIYTELDGITETRFFSSGMDDNGVWINHYKIIFICKGCGCKVESENDYYQIDIPRQKTYEEKMQDAKKNLKPGCSVFEEIGRTVLNIDIPIEHEINLDKNKRK